MKPAIATLGSLALLLGAGPTSAAVVAAPLNKPVVVDGVRMICEGPHSPALAQPVAYPVRVELAANGEQIAKGLDIKITDARDQPVVEVSCVGPHLLLNLPRGGRYNLDGRVVGSQARAKRAVVKSPATGQARTTLWFSKG
jgi:hypothetical protein